jgi:nucleoside-diphosphate-sugar epimerase
VRRIRRILVLGGCGLIGSYLVRELLEEGYEVTVVDRAGDFLIPVERNERLIRVSSEVEALTPKDYEGYDVVVLLAAILGGVRFFHRYPFTIARENTRIVLSVVENLISLSPSPLLIYFSSSMVFERADRGVEEEDLREMKIPLTSYGLGKLFGERVVTSASEEYGLSYLIVRPFNAVGAGETPLIGEKGEILWGMRHVIPEFVLKAILKENPFTILGDGNQVRTFTHCADIARGVVAMVKKGIRNEVFHLCGEERYTVRELARVIWETINPGDDLPEIRSLPREPYDVGYRTSTSQKARRLLGWEPRYRLNDILSEVVPFIRRWWEGVRKGRFPEGG